MLKTKECLICSKSFTNERRNGGLLGDMQFNKSRFCSLVCSGVNQRGKNKPKHSDEWKREQSERLREQHESGVRKGIFTREVRRKMSESARNKPPMSESTRKKIGDANRGEKNSAWKGEEVGYSGLHIWVRHQLGEPKKCSHCGTEQARKYEWANISHKYRRDVNDFIRLCTRCHRNYDNGNLILRESHLPPLI